jgi:tetraacyldisaccharide 4'-kinase
MICLAFLGWFYLLAIRLRHWLYDNKVLSQHYAPLPVVSIGNLVAGGAGKTQVALMLAKQLSETIPVAVLSRGYRSWAERTKEPLVVDIKKHAVACTGDEPWLLASRLTHKQAIVVVNKRRFQGALVAGQRGARLAILDDGMQHRALYRDFEIVVVDGRSALGSFLPLGKLREDPTRLKVADVILFVGHPCDSVLKSVLRHTQAPYVVAEIIPEGVFDLEGQPLESIQGKKVALFCGIGNPARFVNTVEALGADVLLTHFSADHRIPTALRLFAFADTARQKGASLLLCTEKDKVKLSSNRLPLPLGWIRAGLQIVKHQEAWNQLIDKVKLSAGIVP